MIKTINLSELIEIVERYWPLIVWLEENLNYGDALVNMHGKRPQKVRNTGREIILKRTPLHVVADEMEFDALFGEKEEPDLDKTP